MKGLTEGAHQTSDYLTVANIAVFWHTSLWKSTVHCGIKCQTCSLGVDDKVGKLSKWKHGS